MIHITPAYIQANAAYARANHDRTGLLITRLQDGDLQPEPPEGEDQSGRTYFTSELAAFIKV